MRGTSLSCGSDPRMSSNSDRMSCSRMPSRLTSLVKPHRSIRFVTQGSSWMSNSLVPIAPAQDQVFSDLSTRLAVQHFQKIASSLVTLDLLHRLIRRRQANDRAQVSMSVHIQHLGSEISRFSVPRILHSVSLSRFRRSFINKKRSSTCFMRPRPIFVCC